MINKKTNKIKKGLKWLGMGLKLIGITVGAISFILIGLMLPSNLTLHYVYILLAILTLPIITGQFLERRLEKYRKDLREKINQIVVAAQKKIDMTNEDLVGGNSITSTKSIELTSRKSKYMYHK